MANITTKDKLMVCFPYGHFNWSIASRENIYKVVSAHAYHDMTPRHLKGIGNYKKEKEDIFNYITDQLILYFSESAKTKEEFEKWHKNICEEICRRFSSLPDIDLKFGKAQKLINISFKHLYCFANSDSKAEHFKYCHIPINSNVISWCNKNAGIRKPQTAWSNLSYDDYHKFQECLSMWLNSDANTEYRDSDGIPYSLLQLDFIAWISVPDTRKGIIDTWQKFRNTSELWDKYEETVLSVFSELSK